MRKPDRRSLAEWTARLAVNNARTADYIDTLPSRVDALVEAADKSDWSEVRRLCTLLARSCSAAGCTVLSSSAQRVCESLDQPIAETAIRRRIIHLVGDCGTIRKPAGMSVEKSRLAL